METVIRYVRDIESDQRMWLESEVGHQIQDDQRVIMQVLPPGDALGTEGEIPKPRVVRSALIRSKSFSTECSPPRISVD